MFSTLKNVGLNDMHLYNVNNNNWMTVVIYNSVPFSRWGHSMCLLDSHIQDYQASSLLIFGGINMKSYCDTTVHEVNFDKRGVSMYFEHHEQKLEELAKKYESMTPAREREK